MSGVAKWVVMVVAVGILGGCGRGKPGAPLRVGCEATFPPFEYVDEKTGEIVGFDVELVRAIAAAEGLEVEFTNLGFDGLIPALQTGNVDIVASGMTITDEREQALDFTDSYIDAGLAIAVAAGNDTVKGPEDLKGLTVAVQIGTSGAKVADDLKAKGQITGEIKTYDNITIAFQELVTGNVQAVINDIPVSQAFIARYPGKIAFAGQPLNSEKYGFAVATGNTALREKLNRGLATVKANGTYQAIHERYFK